jgi:hypothetical protein
VKASLQAYCDKVSSKELLHLEARACLILLEQLIEIDEIFSYVKPPTSTGKAKKVDAKPKSVGTP